MSAIATKLMAVIQFSYGTMKVKRILACRRRGYGIIVLQLIFHKPISLVGFVRDSRATLEQSFAARVLMNVEERRKEGRFIKVRNKEETRSVEVLCIVPWPYS